MSELTNIHARAAKDLTTPTDLPADPDALDQVKLVAGNFPKEYSGSEALTLGMVKEAAAQRMEPKLNEALSQLSTAANKFYPTLAAANADIANIAVNQPVQVGEVANGGLWYKATSGATSLTKSAYDPLTQAKTYADAAKSEAISAAAEDATSKADAAKSAAISAAAIDASTKADAAKSEAINHIDSIVKTNPSESLFNFNDSEENTVAKILNDGDIETAKFGKISELSERTLDEAKLYTDTKTKPLNKNFLKSLFDFNDSDGSTVAIISTNGDLVLADLGDKGVSEHIKSLRSVAANASESQSLFELRDLDGNLVFDFTNSGDLIFGGGESLKALASKGGDSVVRIPSRYELLTDDFNSLISNYRNLSHVSDLPIPIGLCSQQFKISDKQEFLNLKISQPERIKIDTPYYQDDHVVHPFLCSVYKTFRGFEHILILTPYHNTRDIFENPCVYGSNDLLNFELLSDMPQPIYERYPGDYNYNSDSFGIYDHTTGEFCVAWRNGSTASGFDLWLSKTSDGIHWSERQQLIPKTAELILSPNILYNPKLNKWVMYSISNDVIHGAFTGNKFNYRLADDLYGPWSEPVFIDTPSAYTPWHQEVRYCGNQFVVVINDNYNTGQLYLGISDDGLTWDFKNVGMIDGVYLNSYKASIVPTVTENSVQFDIFWTSSNRANGDAIWQLFHAKTQSIQIEGI